MDVNWYVADTMVRQHQADLRAFVARHHPPAATPPRPWRSALGPAAIRLSHRLLGGLEAIRLVAGKRLG